MYNNFEHNAIIFLQSEGRGHITQAFALQETIKSQNIGVSAIIIRRTTKKQTIQLLKRRFNCPILFIESFEFFKGDKGKSVNLIHTAVDALFKFPKILLSCLKLKKDLRKIKYEIIFNFYEPACTFYNFIAREKFRTIGISHQNIYLHPDFKFPEKNTLNANFLKNYTKLIAKSSRFNIALSFYPLSNIAVKNLIVTGPLLREKVKNLEPIREQFILIYLAYHELLEEVIQWHNKHPMVNIHCFTDKPGIVGVEKLTDNFSLHAIDEDQFIDHLSRCNGLVTTAGFESVSEAMYLDKSVMMVPIKNHFEQYCNSRDAQKAEAGIAADSYDIQLLLNYIQEQGQDSNKKNFRVFTNQSSQIIINLVSLILNQQNKYHLSLTDNIQIAHAQNSLRH